jgi:hypothetical protein
MPGNNKKRQIKELFSLKKNMKDMNHKRKAITTSTSALGSYCKQEKTCVNSLVLCRVHTSTICFKTHKFLILPYPITCICQEYAHGTWSCAATIHRYQRGLYRVRLPILDGDVGNHVHPGRRTAGHKDGGVLTCDTNSAPLRRDGALGRKPFLPNRESV